MQAYRFTLHLLVRKMGVLSKLSWFYVIGTSIILKSEHLTIYQIGLLTQHRFAKKQRLPRKFVIVAGSLFFSNTLLRAGPSNSSSMHYACCKNEKNTRTLRQSFSFIFLTHQSLSTNKKQIKHIEQSTVTPWNSCHEP